MLATTDTGKPRLAYGISEFCEAVGLGKSKIYLEIASGALRARKLGKRTIIEVDDAKAWLRNLPQKAA